MDDNEKEIALKRIEADLKIAQIEAATKVMNAIQVSYTFNQETAGIAWKKIFDEIKKG